MKNLFPIGMRLLAFLLLFCAQSSFAQVITFNLGGPATKNYYEEIPYENLNGHLFVTCEIAGKKHRFLFDTGAPVAISKEFAMELGAKVLSKVKVVDNFLRSDSTTVVELNGIKLGNLTFNGIPAINLFPDFYTCFQIDGVIGSNMLRNSIVSINSQKKTIIITDQKSKLQLKAKNGAKMITNQGMQSDPRIQFYINKKVHAYITFDTGDSDFIRLNDQLINQLKPYGVVDSLTTGYGSGGISAFGSQKSTQKSLYGVDPFTIGDAKFSNLRAVSNKSDMPAIGSKLLEYGTITLDYINGKFYFDAYQSEVDLTQKRWNANVGFVDNKLVVAEVWEKDSSIEQSAQVLAIDDVEYNTLTLCEYLDQRLSLLKTETAVLTIKTSQGEIKKVTINKR